MNILCFVEGIFLDLIFWLFLTQIKRAQKFHKALLDPNNGHKMAKNQFQENPLHKALDIHEMFWENQNGVFWGHLSYLIFSHVSLDDFRSGFPPEIAELQRLLSNIL